ncbi:ASIC5-like protein [Mya arenaria]|uniref:ASIC5-like protein n=1 Tax=Mya arenaria TaxID=6604 RepID=A0ABY7FF19_MYAAR|nr:ASIC5-like protein [Mya arenaria]
MWLLLVLESLAAVIFQIVDRVNYYYSLPLNVNVQINYNKSMDFPAVKICNQNAFSRSQSISVDAGLRLALNIERYEYMVGPHNSAGLKILLHHPMEMPFVHELGQAVPTGTHAYFGVTFMAVVYLFGKAFISLRVKR